jgi:hypothetical protein
MSSEFEHILKALVEDEPVQFNESHGPWTTISMDRFLELMSGGYYSTPKRFRIKPKPHCIINSVKFSAPIRKCDGEESAEDAILSIHIGEDFWAGWEFATLNDAQEAADLIENAINSSKE